MILVSRIRGGKAAYPMRNIKLILEYDGSRYDGWQKQPGNPKSNTIQEKIEAVLNKMEEEKEAIEVIGGARTEPGVHANGQAANFKTASSMSLLEIKRYLNRFLPMDIAVLDIQEVPERFHAAFLAKSFSYEYHISYGEVPSVFTRKYQYYSFQKPDIGAMKQAARFLVGKHDFKAFSDNKRMKKSTERTLYDLDIYGDDQEMVITITADDFWPRMARIMAGTLLEIGKGQKKPDEMEAILMSKDRESAGEAAEAKGLFLHEIRY